jgi:asparagine synthase (glutamine-hydrolysing)
MTDILQHRGPEDVGFYQDETVSLGHRRLSIIDLVTGHQPIHNEDQTIWVVYNGEIYNFPEIKQELAARGHKFHTASDTEVLVHLYEEHGEGLADKLNGIFAFALWDKPRKRLLLVRDQVGVKPLYYYFNNQTLLFASEIKALLLAKQIERKLDPQSLHYFLNLRFIPGEGTLFQGIKKLPPACLLIYENQTIKLKKYWQLAVNPQPALSREDYQQGIVHHLREAIRRQLISDVPLGVYLSGGMDSSSIVALMSQVTNGPINTFSMAFGEPTDELEDAKLIARRFNTRHHELTIEPDPLKYLPRVIWHAEEPKVNLLQGYLIAKFASQHVKVVQGGLGGDELFAGYVNNQFIYPSQPFHRLMPSFITHQVLARLSSLVFTLQDKSGRLRWDEYRRGLQMLLALGDKCRYYLILRNVWDYEEANFGHIYDSGFNSARLKRVKELYEPYFADAETGFMDQVLVTEFHTKLADDFLLNEDRMSMANSLEVRVPFLDKDLVEFAFSIPSRLKIKGNHTKYIFKRAMAQVLPPSTLTKKKWGFAINPYFQFKKDLKYTAQRILTPKRINQRGLFNYAYIKKILDHPPHPRLRWHYMLLWMLVGFEIWHQMFIEGGDFKNLDFDIENYYD